MACHQILQHATAQDWPSWPGAVRGINETSRANGNVMRVQVKDPAIASLLAAAMNNLVHLSLETVRHDDADRNIRQGMEIEIRDVVLHACLKSVSNPDCKTKGIVKKPGSNKVVHISGCSGV